MPIDQAASPSFIKTVRQALAMSQQQFGLQVGVDKAIVARWESGKLKPAKESIRAIQRLRSRAVRRGVPLDAEPAN